MSLPEDMTSRISVHLLPINAQSILANPVRFTVIRFHANVPVRPPGPFVHNPRGIQFADGARKMRQDVLQDISLGDALWLGLISHFTPTFALVSSCGFINDVHFTG